MDQHLIPPICIQAIIQSTTVWLFQMQAMYVHLFLATYGAQIWNQLLKESLKVFLFVCFMGKLSTFLPPPSIREYWKTVEGIVISTTNISAATKVVMRFSFMENLSLLLASSRGSYLILYSTCIWEVCEYQAADEWRDKYTHCRGVQSSAKLGKIPGRKSRWGHAVLE